MADLDGDGRLDLAVTCASSDGLSIFLNVGGGSFADTIHYPPPESSWMDALAVGDVSGDGWPDFVYTRLADINVALKAVGPKNWLFVGSDDGGAVNATFTSLLASARLCGVEPWSYLRDVLCLIHRWPEHDLLDLAPLRWAKTLARDEVRALLDANPFRRLTLDARG